MQAELTMPTNPREETIAREETLTGAALAGRRQCRSFKLRNAKTMPRRALKGRRVSGYADLLSCISL